MFRPRPRSDFPQLDRATSERLLDGIAGDDVPDSYQRVAELLAAVRGPSTSAELAGAAAAEAAFLAAHHEANRPPVRHARPVAAMAVTTAFLVASTGTAAAATEGALPQAAQAVAHEALGVVGISVPDVAPQHPDSELRGGSTSTAGPSVPTPNTANPSAIASVTGTVATGIAKASAPVTTTAPATTTGEPSAVDGGGGGAPADHHSEATTPVDTPAPGATPGDPTGDEPATTQPAPTSPSWPIGPGGAERNDTPEDPATR